MIDTTISSVQFCSVVLESPIPQVVFILASNNNEPELSFTRRVSSRLRDQGVELRPIDPQCSALRDRTEQVQSLSAR